MIAYTINMSEKTVKLVGPECLGSTARLLSRVISGVYDDALAKVGLKVSQFSLLNAITNNKDAGPAELAKSLAMDESTLSRNVARMCIRGWLLDWARRGLLKRNWIRTCVRLEPLHSDDYPQSLGL